MDIQERNHLGGGEGGKRRVLIKHPFKNHIWHNQYALKHAPSYKIRVDGDRASSKQNGRPLNLTFTFANLKHSAVPPLILFHYQ